MGYPDCSAGERPEAAAEPRGISYEGAPYVTAIVSTLTSLPFTQLRKNRYFYFWYDGFYFALCASLIAAMRYSGHRPLIESWDARYWLLLPLVCQAQILCSVWIHNCSHGNFPRTVNRLIGELCGVVVLTRFASWEVIHQRHHRYSDDTVRDPHPVMRSYWRYVIFTLVNVERQLQATYFDLYGNSSETRRSEKLRAALSFSTMLALLACWYTFLGPLAFFRFFVPATIIGILHLIHFNWSTHNAFSPRSDFRPVNLNTGYYRIGNLLWHGIYWHANHHRKANLFNPGRMRNGEAIVIPGE
jgi:stearoyl-CoA desaturase (delta-9 desaturase)